MKKEGVIFASLALFLVSTAPAMVVEEGNTVAMATTTGGGNNIAAGGNNIPGRPNFVLAAALAKKEVFLASPALFYFLLRL